MIQVHYFKNSPFASQFRGSHGSPRQRARNFRPKRSRTRCDQCKLRTIVRIACTQEPGVMWGRAFEAPLLVLLLGDERNCLDNVGRMYVDITRCFLNYIIKSDMPSSGLNYDSSDSRRRGVCWQVMDP